MKTSLDKATVKEAPARTGHCRLEKTIQELAAEQGVGPAKWTDIYGAGADLWESDEEFDAFLAGIYTRRREDREKLA